MKPIFLLAISFLLVGCGQTQTTTHFQSVRDQQKLVSQAQDVGAQIPDEPRGLKLGYLTPGNLCQEGDLDIILVIDRSGSMGKRESDGRKKIEWAKKASQSFIDAAADSGPGRQVSIRIGVASFGVSGPTTTLDSPLGNDYPAVKTAIENLPSISGGTCISCGLKIANDEFVNNPSAEAGTQKIQILLSDGRDNHLWDGSRNTSGEATIAEAERGRADLDMVYYTVGFGENVNETLLTAVANDPDDEYYRYRPDATTWATTFVDLFLAICAS